MGKKHIVQTNQEELIKEQEKVDKSVNKEVKVKSKNAVREARIYISSSYNNTIISLTNNKGDVLAVKSAGAVGFKGAKKSTSFAASKVAEALTNIAKKLGIEKLEIFVKGIGPGRESAVRTLAVQGFEVSTIKDVTPIPHNGTRPKKVRRV